MGNFNNDRGGFGGGGGRGGFGSRGGFGGRGGFGRNRSDGGMHQATCSDCGNSCEVPFKPMHGKSVFCTDCFRKNRDSDSGRSGGGNFRRENNRDNRDRPMFKATCAECGESCEVPFRPNGEKPVYCTDCFGGSEKGFDTIENLPLKAKKAEPSNDQLNQLNAKLDKILKALEIIMQKKEFIVERSEEKPEAKKPEAKATKETPISSKGGSASGGKKAPKASKPKKKK